MTRQLLLLTLTLAILSGAVACDHETTTGGPMPGPGSAQISGSSVPERDPDILVSIYSTGPEGDPGTRVPDFQLRRDGTVFVNGDTGLGIDSYQLTDTGVQAVLDLVTAASLHDDAFGDLEVTDLPNTSVYLNTEIGPAEGPIGVRVYGLDYGDRTDLEADLEDDQVEARLELREVLSTLADLTEDADDPDDASSARAEWIAAPSAPHVPSELELMVTPATDLSGRDLDLADAVQWPLDKPLTEYPLQASSTGLCTTLRGAEAAAVAALVESPDDQLVWTTGADPGSGLPTHVRLDIRGRPFEQPSEGSSAHQPDPGPWAEPSSLCQDDAPDTDGLGAPPLSPVTLTEPSQWHSELPVDEIEAADPLEVFAAAPILVAGMEDHREAQRGESADPTAWIPTGRDLTWYTYDAVIATADGTRYLDVEATRTPQSDNKAPRWRARIDLVKKTVPIVKIDPS